MNQKKGTILIVEDDAAIRKLLTIVLEDAGYKVVGCDRGKEGIHLAASISPELVLLDINLPDINGKEVLTSIREWSQVPIIICSIGDSDEDFIEALEMGADDYVTKPFSSGVMLARIHANLRKAATHTAGEPTLTNGAIHMDLVRHEVLLNGKKALLTPKEYDLLRYFLINRGKMLTHRDILKHIWGDAHVEDMQYLRIYIGQLREKLNAAMSNSHYISTAPGIGYLMEAVTTMSPARDSVNS